MLWPRLERTNEEFSDSDILHYVLIRNTLNSLGLISKLSLTEWIYGSKRDYIRLFKAITDC